MNNEVKHKNGDPYPEHLAKAKKLTVEHRKLLCTYLFTKGEVRKREAFLNEILSYHEELTGIKISGGIRPLAKLMESAYFEKDQDLQGYYKYVGPSKLIDTEESVMQEVDLPVVTEEYEAENLGIKPDSHLTAKKHGQHLLYVWWHLHTEQLAELKGEDCWAMKVGVTEDIEQRFNIFKTDISHPPRLGLLVSCEDAHPLEKFVHFTLNLRDKKIGKWGSEWFTTNVEEILEILKFGDLID